MKDFVVQISIEGHLCRAWLCRGGTTSNDFYQAKTFSNVEDAVKYLSAWEDLDKPWVLGVQVLFKGLSGPNPG